MNELLKEDELFALRLKTSDGPIATQIQQHTVRIIYLCVVSLTGALSNDGKDWGMMNS